MDKVDFLYCDTCQICTLVGDLLLSLLIYFFSVKTLPCMYLCKFIAVDHLKYHSQCSDMCVSLKLVFGKNNICTIQIQYCLDSCKIQICACTQLGNWGVEFMLNRDLLTGKVNRLMITQTCLLLQQKLMVSGYFPHVSLYVISCVFCLGLFRQIPHLTEV